MTSPHPMTRCGDTIVVFEGEKRIAWHERTPECWTPAELWPDPREAGEIRAAVAAGGRLLVVLDAAETVVSAMPEELESAPPTVLALAGEPAGELIHLRVPMLDWLPASLRARGLRFLSRSIERKAATPAALLPALVFDDPDPSAPHVRFAHRLKPGVRLDHDIDAIVAHCFVGATSGAEASGRIGAGSSGAEPGAGSGAGSAGAGSAAAGTAGAGSAGAGSAATGAGGGPRAWAA
jgi:hypothetical protein